MTEPAETVTVDAFLSERDWQARVVAFAKWHEWRVFHPYDSRRSAAGFPDLCMLRGERLLFVELKTVTGRVSPAQRLWLDDLARVPCVGVFVWRPGDWPTVQQVLA